MRGIQLIGRKQHRHFSDNLPSRISSPSLMEAESHLQAFYDHPCWQQKRCSAFASCWIWIRIMGVAPLLLFILAFDRWQAPTNCFSVITPIIRQQDRVYDQRSWSQNDMAVIQMLWPRQQPLAIISAEKGKEECEVRTKEEQFRTKLFFLMMSKGFEYTASRLLRTELSIVLLHQKGTSIS